MAKLTATEVTRFVAGRRGAENPAVQVGPAPGEDAAAVRTQDGTLVVSTDPVSLAADRIGDIGISVASNDVAAAGGRPEFVTSTILLPELDRDLLDHVTAQLDASAKRLGLTIVGGHTEAVPALERPLLSLTCMGYTDRFVPTGGADPGDRILLTKGAGIEATAVLASDFGDDARAAGVPDADVESALDFFDDLTVLPESAVLAPVATAMHDPTEGGVVAGLVEMGMAGDCCLVVDPDRIPMREETRSLCDAMGVDPFRVLGSGALLAAVPEAEADETLDALDAEGIVARDIGVVEAGDGDEVGVQFGDEWVDDVPVDAMYDLWE
jgi:hydrogenase expression/formation protein HypE